MTIIFICGSLEPDRDGVGDYTRRLATELIKQGHQIAAVALNEQHIVTELDSEHKMDAFILPVLRLPSIWSFKKRITRANEWINGFNPDWLSLQYVPFSFHSKGLPFHLSNKLLKLVHKKKWHVMVHELWVGMEVDATKKHVLWGWLQKRIILDFIKKLKPSIIHTQTKLYQQQLSKAGVKSEYLPLFSNIPVRAPFPENINSTIYFVVFGTIHGNSKIEQFAKDVAAFSKSKGVKIVLLIIGRSGYEMNFWLNTWTAEGLEVEVLGEQPAAYISEVLSKSAIGISTNPIELIEKSGTAMAMLDHGLPILSVAKEWTPRGQSEGTAPPGVYKYKKEYLDMCLASRQKHFVRNTVLQISNIFVKSLNESSQF